MSLELFENYLKQMLQESKDDFERLKTNVDNAYGETLEELRMQNKELSDTVKKLTQQKLDHNPLTPFIRDRFEKQK